MPTYRHGRHEHGQNFLHHRPTINSMVSLVASTTGPIIEIGPGQGALTTGLAKLGRDLTAVEIDAHLAFKLQQQVPHTVTIENADFLSYRLPATPHVLVGNLPFHLTTAILRRVLHAPGWTHAVLLMQWEVARRRAGVGGNTMMTSQWQPWFSFDLHGRIPARAFTPRPGVDGGLLVITRREQPHVPWEQRKKYQALVHRVYTGPGRGLSQILARTTSLASVKRATDWLASHQLAPIALPGSLPLAAWVELFSTTRPGSHGAAHGQRRFKPGSREAPRPGRKPRGGRPDSPRDHWARGGG